MKKVTILLALGLLTLGPFLITLSGCQSKPPFPAIESPLPTEQPIAPVVLPPKSAPFWIDVKQSELENEWKTLRTQTPTEKNKLSLIEAFYRLGKKAVEKRHGHLAIKSLKDCLKRDPRNIECHWELGWAHYIEHSYQKSHQQFQWVLRHQPDRDGLKILIAKLKNLQKVQAQALVLRKHAAKSISYRPSKGEKILNISAVGDTMLGSATATINLPPRNQSTLALISSSLKKGDLIFANHEGTLCKETISTKCQGLNGSTCYAFATPPPYIEHLKSSGINLVSLANNHILDFGETCRAQTESLFSTQGIPWSGRKGSVARMDAGGLPVSFIAFHASELTNSTIDIPTAREMVQKEKAAKRLVVVSFHGGAEGVEALHLPNPPGNEMFLGENRGNVIEFSRKMVDAGADLILGSGPHVVRGMEIYKDRLIAYSLGNFATYRLFNLWGFNGVGLILQVKLRADGRLLGGRIVSTKQIEFGVPVLDKNREALDLIRYLSSKDLGHTGLKIGLDGTFANSSKKHALTASDEQLHIDSDPSEVSSTDSQVHAEITDSYESAAISNLSTAKDPHGNSTKWSTSSDSEDFSSRLRPSERSPAEAAAPLSTLVTESQTTVEAPQHLAQNPSKDTPGKEEDPFAIDPIAGLENAAIPPDEDPEEYLKD